MSKIKSEAVIGILSGLIVGSFAAIVASQAVLSVAGVVEYFRGE